VEGETEIEAAAIMEIINEKVQTLTTTSSAGLTSSKLSVLSWMESGANRWMTIPFVFGSKLNR
jgi:hypothetical protein